MAAAEADIVWSPEAERDLQEIWSYLAREASPDVADARLRAIGAACEVIREHPFAGRARDELVPRVRSIAVAPHVVFYRATENLIEIVRVLDGRRDIDEVFSD